VRSFEFQISANLQNLLTVQSPCTVHSSFVTKDLISSVFRIFLSNTYNKSSLNSAPKTRGTVYQKLDSEWMKEGKLRIRQASEPANENERLPNFVHYNGLEYRFPSLSAERKQ
jgi:hypothetical protein